MARKKSSRKSSKSRKKAVVCSHDWRGWTWTHTSWFDGTGYKIHRACKKCSLIDWAHHIPAKKHTPEGMKQCREWIDEAIIAEKKSGA